MHPILALTVSPKASHAIVPEEPKPSDLQAGTTGETENEVSFAAIFDVTAEKLTPKTVAESEAKETALPLPEEGEQEGLLSAAQAKPDDIKRQVVLHTRPDRVLLDDTGKSLGPVPQEAVSLEPSMPKEHHLRDQVTNLTEQVSSLPEQVPIESHRKSESVSPTQKDIGSALVKTVENSTVVITESAAKSSLNAPLQAPQNSARLISAPPETFAQPSPQVAHPTLKQSEQSQSALLSLQAKTMVRLSDAEHTTPITNKVTSVNTPEQSKLPNPMITAIQPASTTQTRRGNFGSDHPEHVAATSSIATRTPMTTPQQWNAIQPLSTIAPAETLKTSTALEPDMLAMPRSEMANTANSITAMPTRTDLPHHMARQIAEVLQHMPNRPVEITLSPEELGRVRLGISTSEGNIIVSILAERPETTELMRRHISALETAFQELGYSDITFSFAGGNDAQADGEDPAQGKSQTALIKSDTPETEIAQLHLNAVPLSGVDIRL